MKTNQKGFTLIELLVVIAIIGLLSTLAIISLNSARSKARDAKRVSDLRQIQTVMEVYYTDNGSYDVACDASAPVAVSACTADLGSYVPNLSQIADPSEVATLCTASSTAQCEYAITASSDTGYTISFWTENTSVQGLASGSNHSLTQNGLQ